MSVKSIEKRIIEASEYKKLNKLCMNGFLDIVCELDKVLTNKGLMGVEIGGKMLSTIGLTEDIKKKYKNEHAPGSIMGSLNYFF